MNTSNTLWPSELPASFYDGLSQFNAEQFYACHETLEALWLTEKSSVRELYQGVLQIAVGCFHLVTRSNWIGAVNKLSAGARRLERTEIQKQPDTNGFGLYHVDWSELIVQSDGLEEHLRTLGIEHIRDFDRAYIPKIHYALSLTEAAPNI